MIFCNEKPSATNNELFFAASNKQISQRATSDYLQRWISATGNEQTLQRVKGDFL